jgi:hypothetical protein
MAVTHAAPVRDMICDLIVDALDAGAAPGRCYFLGVTGNIVAVLTFGKPAFADAVNGTAIANEIASDASAIGGTVARAELRDGYENMVVCCDVGLTGSGEMIELSALTVQPQQEVGLSALSYSFAA